VSDAKPHADSRDPGHADASQDGPAAATTRDRVLLVVFWAWAAVLVVVTLAQLCGWDGLLDALDVKRWFAK
jgi:hypothetical protein